MAEPGFLPPPEVTGYFDRKALRPAFSWLDVWAEEHAHAFTVAKATELELLTTFRNSISGAIAKGQGFEAWKSDVQKDLVKTGWWGPRMVSDPAGIDPDRMVDFSASKRLGTIFWSNANSARSAGQWERAQRSKAALPYILYVRTSSADPRPEHLAWVGIILPVDDPFWRTHWPPNGWGCKCQVRQISAREAERFLGRAPEEGGIFYTREPPDLGPPVEFRNRRTGEVTQVPPGIDPGWHTNAGLSRATTLIDHLDVQLAAGTRGEATARLTELWADPYLRAAPKLPQKTFLPAGRGDRLAEIFAAAGDGNAVSPIVSIATDTIVERIGRHGMVLEDFALLPDIIDRATILPDEAGDPSVRTLIARFGRTWWRVFIKLSSGGYMRVNSMHQRRIQEMRRTLARHGLSTDDVRDMLEED